MTQNITAWVVGCGCFDPIGVAQVEGVDERHRPRPRPQVFDVLDQLAGAAVVHRRFGQQLSAIALPLPAAGGWGAASAIRRAMAPFSERTTSMLAGLPALLKPARTDLNSVSLANWVRTRLGSSRSSKNSSRNSSRDRSNTKSSSPLAAVVGLTATPPCPAAALRPGGPVAGDDEFLVAGMDGWPRAAARSVAGTPARTGRGRDVDFLAVVDVGDAAAVHGLGHGLLDLIL